MGTVNGSRPSWAEAGGVGCAPSDFIQASIVQQHSSRDGSSRGRWVPCRPGAWPRASAILLSGQEPISRLPSQDVLNSFVSTPLEGLSVTSQQAEPWFGLDWRVGRREESDWSQAVDLGDRLGGGVVGAAEHWSLFRQRSPDPARGTVALFL